MSRQIIIPYSSSERAERPTDRPTCPQTASQKHGGGAHPGQQSPYCKQAKRTGRGKKEEEKVVIESSLERLSMALPSRPIGSTFDLSADCVTKARRRLASRAAVAVLHQSSSSSSSQIIIGWFIDEPSPAFLLTCPQTESQKHGGGAAPHPGQQSPYCRSSSIKAQSSSSSSTSQSGSQSIDRSIDRSVGRSALRSHLRADRVAKALRSHLRDSDSSSSSSTSAAQ